MCTAATVQCQEIKMMVLPIWQKETLAYQEQKEESYSFHWKVVTLLYRLDQLVFEGRETGLVNGQRFSR